MQCLRKAGRKCPAKRIKVLKAAQGSLFSHLEKHLVINILKVSDVVEDRLLLSIYSLLGFFFFCPKFIFASCKCSE